MINAAKRFRSIVWDSILSWRFIIKIWWRPALVRGFLPFTIFLFWKVFNTKVSYTIHFISSIRNQSASWPGPWISKPIFRKLGPRVGRPWCADPCLSRSVLHWSSIKYDSFYFFSQVSKQSSANLEFQGQSSENLVPGWTESGARIPDLLIHFLFNG